MRRAAGGFINLRRLRSVPGTSDVWTIRSPVNADGHIVVKNPDLPFNPVFRNPVPGLVLELRRDTSTTTARNSLRRNAIPKNPFQFPGPASKVPARLVSPAAVHESAGLVVKAGGPKATTHRTGRVRSNLATRVAKNSPAAGGPSARRPNSGRGRRFRGSEHATKCSC